MALSIIFLRLCRLFSLLWSFFFVFLSVSEASGQFTTIINVPPDVIPLRIGSDTQVNVLDGGRFTRDGVGERGNLITNVEVNFFDGSTSGRFYIRSDSTVNVFGGSIGNGVESSFASTVNITGGEVGIGFAAIHDSTVNISGGMVRRKFEAFSSSTVNISGGTIGDNFRFSGSSTVNFFGGEFRLDGVLLSGLENEGDKISLETPVEALFTGTLGDGTPFAFSTEDFDLIGRPNSELTLQAVALPPVGPALITAPAEAVPLGVRRGQTLRVDDGGLVSDNFNAGLGSTVNVEAGGSVGRNLEAVGAKVNISGGTVGEFLNAFSGSIVNISGGTVGDYFLAFSGSTVNISGGTIGNSFWANSGAVNFLGGEFRLDGVLLDGLEHEGDKISLEIPVGALFTGTLGDGTPFAFSTEDDDLIGNSNSELTLQAVVLPPVGPALITASADAVPLGVRQGQTLRVDDGGLVSDNFNAGLGSTVNVEAGGSVGRNLEAVGAKVNISGGTVGDRFDAFSGSIVNISGGTVGDGLRAYSGSTVNMSGGTVRHGFRGFNALSGSTVNISGGTVGDLFNAFGGSTVNISGGRFSETFRGFNALSGSTVNISGGTFGDDFRGFSASGGSTVNISGGTFGGRFTALAESEIHLLGTEFFLDGLSIEELGITGDSLILEVRDGRQLTGTFLGGNTFEFDLNGSFGTREDFFSMDAILRLTLVPEPSTVFLCGLGLICVALGRRRRESFDAPPQ